MPKQEGCKSEADTKESECWSVFDFCDRNDKYLTKNFAEGKSCAGGMVHWVRVFPVTAKGLELKPPAPTHENQSWSNIPVTPASGRRDTHVKISHGQTCP